MHLCFFVICGINKSYEFYDPAIQYDTKKGQKKIIAGMKLPRFDAACTVFDEKIVVSGGHWFVMVPRYVSTNTVEVYDKDTGTWSCMLDMVEDKSKHSLFVIKSNLYLIGTTSTGCEVFDKFTNKFIIIESFSSLPRTYYFREFDAVSFGNKIAIFGKKESTIIFYDTEKDEWYEESCEDLEDDRCISYCKMPQV